MSSTRAVAATVRLEPFGPADFSRLIAWVSPAGSPESLLQ